MLSLWSKIGYVSGEDVAGDEDDDDEIHMQQQRKEGSETAGPLGAPSHPAALASQTANTVGDVEPQIEAEAQPQAEESFEELTNEL